MKNLVKGENKTKQKSKRKPSCLPPFPSWLRKGSKQKRDCLLPSLSLFSWELKEWGKRGVEGMYEDMFHLAKG